MANKKANKSTPEQLLDVAQKLFAEKGFKATTILAIAKKANVNVSLVSYHFGGKEGLFRACLKRAATSRVDASDKILRSCETIDEFKVRIQMFTEELYTYHVENPEICMIIGRDLQSEMKLIRDIFEGGLLAAFHKFVKFLTDAKEKGFIKEWVDPMIAASTHIGAIIHITKHQDIAVTYFAKSLSDQATKNTMVQHMTRSFLLGVSTYSEPI